MHQARHLVMLTNTVEKGRAKCCQYWPPHGQMLHYDDISLFTAEEEEVHPKLFRRKIEVTVEPEDGDAPVVHTVHQLHLTNWPDHEVMDCPTLHPAGAGQPSSSVFPPFSVLPHSCRKLCKISGLQTQYWRFWYF